LRCRTAELSGPVSGFQAGPHQRLLEGDPRPCAQRSWALRWRSLALCIRITGLPVLMVDTVRTDHGFLATDRRHCAYRSRFFRCRSSALCIQITDSWARIIAAMHTDHGFVGAAHRPVQTDRGFLRTDHAAWRQKLWTLPRKRRQTSCMGQRGSAPSVAPPRPRGR
jgi:hypothetical protein